MNKHKSGPKGKRIIDWGSVASELRRNELDCKVKWNALCNATRARKGPYKVEEDQLIVNKVQEYFKNTSGSSSSSSSSNGGSSSSSNDVPCSSIDPVTAFVSNEVWDDLERTMGRPAKNIRLRWKITLSKRVASALEVKASAVVSNEDKEVR